MIPAERTLGEPKEGIHYETRPGAYAVPLHYNREQGVFEVALAKVTHSSTNKEKYVLLGGGIEEGEDHDHTLTLRRELREEVGRIIHPGQFIKRVDEYFYSSSTGKYFKKEGYYYEASLGNYIGGIVEKDHELAILPVELALRKLHHHSAKHIVEYWWKVHRILKKTS